MDRRQDTSRYRRRTCQAQFSSVPRHRSGGCSDGDLEAFSLGLVMLRALLAAIISSHILWRIQLVVNGRCRSDNGELLSKTALLWTVLDGLGLQFESHPLRHFLIRRPGARAGK